MTTLKKLLVAGVVGFPFVTLGAVLATGQRCDAGCRVGYGRCSSCNCKHFEGSSSTCSNCGHNYSRHY